MVVKLEMVLTNSKYYNESASSKKVEKQLLIETISISRSGRGVTIDSVAEFIYSPVV